MLSSGELKRKCVWHVGVLIWHSMYCIPSIVMYWHHLFKKNAPCFPTHVQWRIFFIPCYVRINQVAIFLVHADKGFLFLVATALYCWLGYPRGYLQQDANAFAFSLVFYLVISSLFCFLIVPVNVNFSFDAKRFQIGVITGSRQKYVRKILIFSAHHFAPKKQRPK
jgi:hypothetical protein